MTAQNLGVFAFSGLPARLCSEPEARKTASARRRGSRGVEIAAKRDVAAIDEWKAGRREPAYRRGCKSFANQRVRRYCDGRRLFACASPGAARAGPPHRRTRAASPFGFCRKQYAVTASARADQRRSSQGDRSAARLVAVLSEAADKTLTVFSLAIELGLPADGERNQVLWRKSRWHRAQTVQTSKPDPSVGGRPLASLRDHLRIKIRAPPITIASIAIGMIKPSIFTSH